MKRTHPIGLDVVRHVEVNGPTFQVPNWHTLTIGLTEADVMSAFWRRVIGEPEKNAMVAAIRARGLA